MNDWKKTEYGIPKTWKEIEEERIDADLAKNSASPLPRLIWLAFLGLCVVAGVVYVILSFAR